MRNLEKLSVSLLKNPEIILYSLTDNDFCGIGVIWKKLDKLQ